MQPDSDEVKAARQARLSKALSTAYLTHQIAQLEDKVNHVQLNPQTRAFNPAEQPAGPRQRQLFDDGVPLPPLRGGRGGRGGFYHGDQRGRGGGPDGRGRGGHRGRGGPPDGARGRGGGRGRGDFTRSLPPDHISRDHVGLPPSYGPLALPPSVESNVFPFTKPGLGQTPAAAVALAEQQRRDQAGAGGIGVERHDGERRYARDAAHAQPQRVVVDASAMIWATYQIRRIVKDGGEVIVPVECLRTLDIVKKGMSRVAVAARAAMRFIEDAQRKTATPPSSTAGGPIVDGIQGLGRALRPGLWIQGDGEVVEIFPAAAAPAASSADHDNADRPPVAPQYVKSTLQCALYYRGLWEVPSSTKVLAVAHPPAGKTKGKGSDADAAATATEPEDAFIAKYRARTDGREVAEWAEMADVVCVVLAAKRKKRDGKDRHGGPLDEDVDGVTDELELGEEAIGVRQSSEAHDAHRRNRHEQGQQRHCDRDNGRNEHLTRSKQPASVDRSADLQATAPKALMSRPGQPQATDDTAAEIRALNAAQKARTAPDASGPHDSPKSAPAAPVKLTAEALQQSQAAIHEMEQAHSPRLARPQVSSAVNVRATSDFVPLKREDARRAEPARRLVEGRGGEHREHRAPQSPRQASRQTQGHRRPDPQPEPVAPKMILLQRPKG